MSSEAPPRARFRLTFLSSTAAGYQDAVKVARGCAGYHEEAVGRAIVHTCELMTFTEPEIRRFLQAWNLVQRWHASRLEVDGVYATGMERFTLQRVLECMAKAAAFSPPQRYCHSTSARTLSSAAASASPGRPILIPCRLWASSWGTWGDVDWGDPGRRDDQVRASLADRGVTRCPFLTLEPLPHASGAADVSAADNVIPLRRRNPQAPAP